MFLLSPFVSVTVSSSNCTPTLTFYDLFPELPSFLFASITESLCLLSYGGDFFNQLHMPVLWFSSHQQLVPACSSGAAPGLPLIPASATSPAHSLMLPNGCKGSIIKHSFDLSDRPNRFQITVSYLHLFNVLNTWYKRAHSCCTLPAELITNPRAKITL